MITWQEVVDASAISGSAIGYSNGATATNIEFSNTYGETSDWFGGNIISSATTEQTEFFVLFENAYSQEDNSYTFVWPGSEKEENGVSGKTWITQGVTDNETEISVGDTALSARPNTINTNWSRVTTNLATWQETTLQNQTGRATATTGVTLSQPTTQSVGGSVGTTLTGVPTTRTTTSLVTNSTLKTWEPTAYSTVYLTGQTTAKFYGDFLNEVPAVWISGVETTTKTMEPLSFVEIGGYAAAQNFTVQNITGANESHATTTTTQGAIVTVSNLTDPKTTVGGTAATTISGSPFVVQNTQTILAEDKFATVATSATVSSTKELSALQSTVAVSYPNTLTLSKTTEGYTTYSSDDGNTFSQSGSFFIATKNLFATERRALAFAAIEATVGVRVKSTATAGGGVEEAGRGNAFYPHTTSVFLPASTVQMAATKTTTFSLDSYTVRDSSGNQTISQFAATGAAQSQYMTAATTQSSVARATVLGGPIHGEALIGNGNYKTFAGTSEGLTEVTEPFSTNWSASAATSAWLPAFRAETVGALQAVVAISRHSFTQVLDE